MYLDIHIIKIKIKINCMTRKYRILHILNFHKCNQIKNEFVMLNYVTSYRQLQRLTHCDFIISYSITR